MKTIAQRVTALGLSLCLLLCVPVAASAEDEDLLSHYNGDDMEYLAFLKNYFCQLYSWDDTYYLAYKSAGQEMARMYNTFHNDLSSHPYLRGTIDPESGEITVTGIQFTGFKESVIGALDYLTRYGEWWYRIKPISGALVIPDEIEGHPVTRIADGAFDGDTLNSNDENEDNVFYPSSLVIGNNVREIGNYACFYLASLRSVAFGECVERIGIGAFEECSGLKEIKSWGNHLKAIYGEAFAYTSSWSNEGENWVMPPFPNTLTHIEKTAFLSANLPETIVLPSTVQKISCLSFHESRAKNIVILNNGIEISEDIEFVHTGLHPNGISVGFFFDHETDRCLYCYAGSTTEAFAQKWGDAYQLIDGDSLLWDGKAVEENTLAFGVGMTEEELRSHLSVDGASSEIQIDGLQDGKVVNGTTVTLFHTVAQAPGKVYTVEKKAEPVSVSVETLPTKTNYFYKETFDPSGLSLRVAYDDGTETVVTDGVACTGTDLTVGTNTITATVENQSVTFPVTVRYSWWQQLIRIFLFGFLWY